MTEFKTLNCLQELNIDRIWAARNVFAKSSLTQWYTYFYSLLITMLTIKILFTINSLKKKTHFVKTLYLQFLPLKKPLVLTRKKNHFSKQKLFKLRTFHCEFFARIKSIFFKFRRIWGDSPFSALTNKDNLDLISVFTSVLDTQLMCIM